MHLGRAKVIAGKGRRRWGVLLSAIVVIAALVPSLLGTLVKPASAQVQTECDSQVDQLLGVTTTGDAPIAGSLRQAIDAANRWARDRIAGKTCLVLPAGTYTLKHGPLALSGSGGDTIIIYGENPATTIIDGGGQTRVFNMGSHHLTLNSLTIRGGSASGSGPDGDGGGIRNNNGVLTLYTCRFTDNVASGMGGAIYNASGSVFIGNSILEENSASTGGGIHHATGTMRIMESTISRNQVRSAGGGIWAAPSGGFTTPTGVTPGLIERTALYSNTAGDRGGGIYHAGRNLVLNAVTLGVNMAGWEGGGLYVNGGNVTVNKVTLDGNFVSFNRIPQGTGFAIFNNDATRGRVTLHNSILLNSPFDPSKECAGSVMSLGGNIGYRSRQERHSCGLDAVEGTDILTESRRFVLGNPLVNTELPPGYERSPVQPSSPGIDEADPRFDIQGQSTDPNTGYTWTCERRGTDQLDMLYVDGDGDGNDYCDIGAIEFYPLMDDMVTLLSTETSFSPTPVPHGPFGTYTEVRTYQKRGHTQIGRPFFEVTRLEGGHVLLNPDFPLYFSPGSVPLPETRWDVLGGRGAIVPLYTLNQPDQIFSVTFVFGLQTPGTPRFVVNLRGEQVFTQDQITIGGALVINFPGPLPEAFVVSATSSEAPEAQLFVTVPGCIDTAPMTWNGEDAYVFFTYVSSSCGSLVNREVTVTSDFGGAATAVIQQTGF